MIGYISSIDPKKRCGFIKETGKNFTYYFGYNSIVDKELHPKVGQHVNFELYRKSEKEQVAVRIRSLSEASNHKKNKKRDDEFIDAVVNWFKPEKKYGYVTCENSFDAFLHQNILLKAGVHSVKPKQLLKVKLIEDKYPGKKSVCDVIVLDNSGRNPTMAYPRQPKYPPANFKFSSDDLTEIPSNKSNDKRPGSSHSNSSSHSMSLAPSARMPCHGPPPLHSRMIRPPMQPPPYGYPRMPTSPINPGMNMIPRYPADYFDGPPRTPNRSGYFNRPPRIPNERDFYNVPPAPPNWAGDFNGPPRSPNGPFRAPMQPNVFNGPPITPNGDFCNRPPIAPNNEFCEAPMFMGPNPANFPNRPVREPYQEAFFQRPPRTPNSNVQPSRQSRPSTPNYLKNSGHIGRPRFNSPRNFNQHQRTPITNPEYAKIKQQISQKQNLLKTINISKLPDAGQRLRDQIKELQEKMKNMNMNENIVKTEIVKSKNEKKPTVKPPHLFYDVSCYNKSLLPKPHKSNALGGRSVKLSEIQQVTSDAIERLHESLHTCPPSTDELPDPEGLQITLMVHQRQALAWMVWREKQSVSGGILADDMGLGKTLTMVSLILHQISSTNEEPRERSSKNDLPNENSDTDDSKNDTNSDKSQTPNDKEAEGSTKDGSFAGVTCESTLIVAPASLIYHWDNEIRNRCKKGLMSIHLFHGSDREKDAEKLSEFDVVITTYDIVRRSYPKPESSTATPKDSSSKKEDALFRINWRRIILDEAHQIRNHRSQTSEAVCSLHTRSRWALSGTPIQNDENDMYAMLKFLHCKPFNELKVWKDQVSNKNQVSEKRLKTLVSCLVLRREKSQKMADGKPLVVLPKRTFKTHKLKLNEVEQEVYTKLKQESCSAFKAYEKLKKNKEIPEDRNPYSRNYSNSKEKMSATSLLVRLLRLRQCCSHLHLLKDNFDVDLLEKERQQVAVEDLLESLTLREEVKDESFKTDQYVEEDKANHFEISSLSSKVKYVMDSLHQLNFEKPSEKSVVVSQWTSMLRIMAHHLEQAKLPYAIIEGSVSARKRMTLVDEFNRNPIKPKIMLVSLQAGGVGLNLIGGNHLFFLDMHWNPALEKQAFDRIYRVGQSKEVFVYKLVLEGTVDEQILRLQQEKIFIADSIMAGADAESKVKLTLSDMKMLFGI